MAKGSDRFDINAVQALMNRGEFGEALPSLREASRRTPADAQVLCLLGVCQLRMGSVHDAISSLRRSIERRPYPEAYSHLALAQRLASMPEAAQETLGRGIAKFPENPVIVRAQIEAHSNAGDHEAAIERIEAFGPPDARPREMRMLETAALQGLGRYDEALDVVETILGDTSMTALTRTGALHRKGDILDKLGEYGRAFESHREANALNPARFDARSLEEKTERLIRGWTTELMGSIRAKPGTGGLAVFVLGMPRSGTTLIEQIIGRHSRAHAAGELTILNNIVREIQHRAYEPGDMLVSTEAINARTADRAGREYLRELKKLAKGAERITDKFPSNFRHLGLIASALPGASVLHTVRDPLDTALSCYFQNFGSTNAWSTSPETIGVYYRCYRRLMDHWSSLGVEMLEVSYESLVREQEEVSRRAVEHVGLEWEEACLSFYESDRVAMTASMAQVKQPMYTSSVARHEKYAAHIAPFAEAMGLDT